MEQVLKTNKEWERLLAGLTGIDWHDDPKTPIEQVNP